MTLSVNFNPSVDKEHGAAWVLGARKEKCSILYGGRFIFQYLYYVVHHNF